MEVLVLQVFVSLMLALGGVLLFLYVWRQRDLDHSDRLALLPMEQETSTKSATDGGKRAPETDHE